MNRPIHWPCASLVPSLNSCAEKSQCWKFGVISLRENISVICYRRRCALVSLPIVAYVDALRTFTININPQGWRVSVEYSASIQSVSSRLVSAICVSCPRLYFVQILQATLIKWAKSAVDITAVLTRIGMRVSGWWSDVMVLTWLFAIASKINFNYGRS